LAVHTVVTDKIIATGIYDPTPFAGGDTWDVGGPLTIGGTGTGKVEVQTGGQLTATSITALADGTLHINGGLVDSTGDVNLTAGTLHFDSGTLRVAGTLTGVPVLPSVTVTRADGTTSSAANVQLIDSGQTLELYGSGGQWTSDSSARVFIGNADSATPGAINVTNGASLVTSGNATFLGRSRDSFGNNTITDSTWTSNYTEVGSEGSGTVTINGADADGTGWGQLIQTLDRGTFDVGLFLKTLKDLGYTGPVGLQCYAVPGDKYENLKRSMAAWREISAEIAAEEK